MNLLRNPDFAVGQEGNAAAEGWSVKPERNTFEYRYEAAKLGERLVPAQRVTGEGRGDGYVWQRFSLQGGKRYRVSGQAKTIGETTAALWMLFIDGGGRTIERLESPHALGDSDWTELTAVFDAPAEAAEGMLFLISFTVEERAHCLWRYASVEEAAGENEDRPSRVPAVGPARCPIVPKPKRYVPREGAFPQANRVLDRLRDLNYETMPEALAALRDVVSVGDFRDEAAAGATPLQELGPFPGGEESYALSVEPERIYIHATSPKGTMYALQSLLQLAESAGAGAIPCCAICDWPDLPYRGLHVLIDFYSPSFTKEVIRLAARHKYNAVVLECSMVRWDSHPEIWMDSAGGKAELSDVVRTAKRLVPDVDPLIQSLGHCKWLFHRGANLDICEDPQHPWCYNPLNERSYEVIFDIMDEAVELFRPRRMHIGHDEVRMVGTFPNSPEGRGIGFEKLFVADTNRIASHLRDRGVGTMMWADVVQERAFRTELERLNKDIVMVDWQYHPFRRYQGVARLMELGFPTIGATWHDPENIRSFARFAKGQGAQGILQTTWTGHFGSAVIFDKELHQYTAHLYAAEALWNASAGDKEPFGFDAEALVRNALGAHAAKRPPPDWGPVW